MDRNSKMQMQMQRPSKKFKFLQEKIKNRQTKMATVCLALVCCTHAAPPPRIPEGWVNLVGGNSKRTPTVLQYTKKENNFDDFASGIVQVPTALDLLKARLILTEANHVEKRLPPSAIRLSPAAGLKPCSRRSSSNTISSELTLCSTFNAFNRYDGGVLRHRNGAHIGAHDATKYTDPHPPPCTLKPPLPLPTTNTIYTGLLRLNCLESHHSSTTEHSLLRSHTELVAAAAEATTVLRWK